LRSEPLTPVPVTASFQTNSSHEVPLRVGDPIISG
jgi:hypothetical protein